MLDGVTAVYRSNVDLFFYVIGAQTENEVTLYLLNILVTNTHVIMLQLLLLNAVCMTLLVKY